MPDALVVGRGPHGSAGRVRSERAGLAVPVLARNAWPITQLKTLAAQPLLITPSGVPPT